MDNNRVAAIALALIAALLVMISGKSCSDSISEKSQSSDTKKKNNESSVVTSPFEPYNQTADNFVPENNGEKKKNKNNQNSVSDEIAEETTEIQTGVVFYDENGNPVELTSDIVLYDEDGNVIDISPEEEVTTEKKSLLDEYNEKKNSDRGLLDGYNHSKNNDKKSYEDYEDATFPEDFSITIK